MKYRVILLCGAVIVFFIASVPGQSTDVASPSENNPKAVELIGQAISLEDAGQPKAAIEKYKEVLKIVPKDFAAMNSIAGLYGLLQDPASEVVWAQKAFETNKAFWKALINLGNGLAMQGKFDEAVKAYRDAAVIAPKDPLPVYSMGVVAENRDQVKEALEFYKKSIELDPEFENGLFSAAAMHANLKQFKEAQALLKRLLELNPGDPEAREMLRAVEAKLAKP